MSEQQLYSAIVRALWLNSANISKSLDNSLGAIHGIGFSEYMVLHNLADAPNQLMRRIDLAQAIGRTGSGMTRMLAPLEKIGLVGKETSARDGRVSLVKLTPAGHKIYEEATLSLDQKAASLLKNLETKQAKTFLKLLEQAGA
jgi:DNA-binding MarR family transcriptional regulator